LRNINISSNNELTKIKQIESALAADEEIYSLRKRITQQTEKRLEQGMITMTDYLTDYNAEIKAGLQLETRKIQLIYNKANYLFIRGLL
jgi:outer membrane protein TolC